MTRRRCVAGRGVGAGGRVDAGGGGGRKKRPRRRSAVPVGQGENAAGRPSETGVFARLDDMLARHRARRPPTATTPGSGLTSTLGCASGWRRHSRPPGAGTGTAGSRPCSEPASRRRRSAGSWPRTGLSRMCPDDAGTVPARARSRRRPATRPTGTSPPSPRTGSG